MAQRRRINRAVSGITQTSTSNIQISFSAQNSIARSETRESLIRALGIMPRPLLAALQSLKSWKPALWVLGFGFCSFPTLSQLPPGASGNNIEYPYFDKQSRRPISLLLGKEAIPQPGGLMLIKGLQIQTFDYEGNARQTNFLVSAPSCLLDVRRRIASSDGPLTAKAADGSFAISGRGFEWRQVESHLIISNNVETLLDRALVTGRRNPSK
jgi:hypothetical protein